MGEQGAVLSTTQCCAAYAVVVRDRVVGAVPVVAVPAVAVVPPLRVEAAEPSLEVVLQSEYSLDDSEPSLSSSLYSSSDECTDAGGPALTNSTMRCIIWRGGAMGGGLR